jgi:predicted ArsR family transcriptional regulator
MAAAIARSTATGEPVAEVLNQVAREYGQTIGAAEFLAPTPPAPPKDAAAGLERAVTVLSRYGYQPRFSESEVELANCPFHALAQEQTELACNMNHALITGVADALAPHGPDARLCPGRDRCCVVLKPGPG